MKEKVLFVCIHNSGRSQMAEAMLNRLCGDRFEAHSAGIDPGEDINPLVVQAMAEEGIDLSTRRPKSVFDFVKAGEQFAYVITVCDETSGERCPLFPGVTKRLHWTFSDPANVSGSPEQKIEQVRAIRDNIHWAVKRWCEEVCARPTLA
jgi:arsenate reductase